MRVFTHFKFTGKASESTGIRYCTVLQFGDGWDLIGSVIMKNPGSARLASGKERPLTDSALLEALDAFDDGYSESWYEFSPDLTMHCIEELFSQYQTHNGGTDALSGVIRIFNLFYPRNPDLKAALRNYNPDEDAVDDIPQIMNSLDRPIYIGWGDLYRRPCFQSRARKIFGIVQPHNAYLNPEMEKNRFVHPASLQRYSRNKPQSILERERFFNGRYQ